MLALEREIMNYAVLRQESLCLEITPRANLFFDNAKKDDKVELNINSVYGWLPPSPGHVGEHDDLLDAAASGTA